MDNPVFGIGNLSSRFRSGGFQTFFGHQFYMSDLGIVAVMATGGIVLVFIYWGLYLSIWKKSYAIHDINCRQFTRYMLLGYAFLLLFFFNDILCGDKTIQFALVFYPLFRQQKINYYYKPLTIYNKSKHTYICC